MFRIINDVADFISTFFIFVFYLFCLLVSLPSLLDFWFNQIFFSMPFYFLCQCLNFKLYFILSLLQAIKISLICQDCL
jgi:hypothetical protein